MVVVCLASLGSRIKLAVKVQREILLRQYLCTYAKESRRTTETHETVRGFI